jgi:hypothetical protein
VVYRFISLFVLKVQTAVLGVGEIVLSNPHVLRAGVVKPRASRMFAPQDGHGMIGSRDTFSDMVNLLSPQVGLIFNLVAVPKRRGYLFQRILDDLNLRVPTGTASAAVVALAGSRTAVSPWEALVLPRRDRAYREAIAERRRTIYEVGGVSDAEIRGNSPAHSAICLDGLILPRWEPEFDPRQILADTYDIAKVLDALQIAGIMPAKMAILGPIDKGGDRVYPAGMGQTLEAFLHCRLDVRKHISAAQGVTMEANRLRNLLQEETETVAVGRKRVAVPRHFAGVA